MSKTSQPQLSVVLLNWINMTKPSLFFFFQGPTDIPSRTILVQLCKIYCVPGTTHFNRASTMQRPCITRQVASMEGPAPGPAACMQDHSRAASMEGPTPRPASTRASSKHAGTTPGPAACMQGSQKGQQHACMEHSRARSMHAGITEGSWLHKAKLYHGSCLKLQS